MGYDLILSKGLAKKTLPVNYVHYRTVLFVVVPPSDNRKNCQREREGVTYFIKFQGQHAAAFISLLRPAGFSWDRLYTGPEKVEDRCRTVYIDMRSLLRQYACKRRGGGEGDHSTRVSVCVRARKRWTRGMRVDLLPAKRVTLYSGSLRDGKIRKERGLPYTLSPLSTLRASSTQPTLSTSTFASPSPLSRPALGTD